MVEILDEWILHKSNSYERVRRWLKGIHPERGIITYGYTGWETVEEVDRIRPMKSFEVLDEKNTSPNTSP